MDFECFEKDLLDQRLELSANPLTEESGKEQDWVINHMTETESTNSLLLSGIKSGAITREGSVIVSDFQTSGRGRLERSWYSPPGMGLLFSTLQIVDADRQNPAIIGHLAALCLIFSLKKLVPADCEVLWKWPNDIYLRNTKMTGKIAGILAQSVSQGTNFKIALGIGINVLQSSFPSDLRQPASSLLLAGSEELSMEKLLATLLAHLEYFRPLLANGKELITRLANWDICGENQVVCEFDNKLCLGTVRGYGEDGAIWVSCDDDVRVYHNGEIRIRPENFV
jgi:BirA family transcriptional regulator, biotin operon repressor / biotin---[acetyl-CoA-carboxylase] ligase